MHIINYAHRGASEYAPENTMSSFYLGLLQGANGIETDVQRTKDGVLVLFHDDSVDRVSDGHGKLCDFTLKELKNLKIYGNNTCGFYDRIPTLEEFLDKFSTYDIRFAIELKGAGVEEETLAMIKKYGIEHKTTFTSFQFAYIQNIKEIDGNARVGYLTWDTCETHIHQLLDIGGEEIAPKAEEITEENMRYWRSNNLGVRAWGVSNVALMKKMCDFRVDGMTVNFPDRLYQYVNSVSCSR